MAEKRPLHILLLAEDTFPPVGRGNLRLYRLGLALARQGHRVTMLSPSALPHTRASGAANGIAARQYPGLARFLHSRGKAPVRAYHLLASVVSVWLLKRRDNIDALHAWNTAGGLAAALAGRLIGRPFLVDFTDFYSNIARTDIAWLAPILQVAERFVLRTAARVVAVSDEMAAALMALGVAREKIAVIPDGTDAAMFSPLADGRPLRERYGLGEDPVVIYHGDVRPPDGLDVLFEAFALLLAKRPQARLLVVGGPIGSAQGYFAGLLRRAQALEVMPRTVFTGWVPHAQVPQYIAAADIGAMPMRATLNHNCYLSFKLFEYWGVGKPVVSSRLRAISQVIQHGHNGLLVEPANPQAFAEALLRLIDDPKEAARMGCAGRKLVEEAYHWDILMDREAALYEQLAVSS